MLIMSISIFINEIENVAVLESAFKDKVHAIIEKIKKFIAKVLNWIKTKVYNFLKIDNAKISKEKYDNCMHILNKLDRVKNEDELDELKNSREYKNIHFNGTNDIIIKTVELKSNIGVLNLKLDGLNSYINSLKQQDSADTHDIMKEKQFQIQLITMRIKVLNIIIDGSKFIYRENKEDS